jgi:hypothetical protein
VVLVDLTIALAFIAIIYAFVSTLQSSQALSEMNRQSRQDELRNAIVKRLTDEFPDLQVVPFDGNHRKQVLTMGQSEAFSIQENGSYQRISVYLASFPRGASRLSTTGEAVFKTIGEVVRDKWSRRDYITYVNLHGICGYSEGRRSNDRTDLSRRRADAVLDLFVGSGIVTDDGAGGSIPKSRVIAYGTGAELYAEFPGKGRSVPNRVDVVLFYNDSDNGG